jgi:bifunctional DNA-binding transcriptional regulator/antitoxin component of YhaV-PrlF toxin-antitoxin module
MSNVKYIKSFSKGQITIPKEFREMFGLGDDFWLKIFVDKGRIVAEPTESEQNGNISNKEYLKILERTQGKWREDWQRLRGKRKQVELNASKKRKQAW